MKTLQPSTEIALKSVLFATDFSDCSNAALPYALAMASNDGAKLYATHILSPDSYLLASPDSWPWIPELQGQLQQIDTARLEAQLRGVPHNVLSPVGEISDVLFRLIREHDIDVLVLGSHGRTGLRKLFMGSVAEKIFRQAPIPVLIVGPCVPPPESTVATFGRILFATDFSEESLAALPYAVQMSNDHEARLSILHVLSEPETGTVDLEANLDFLKNRLQQLGPDGSELMLAPNYTVEIGNCVPEQIVNFAASHRIDLIVLGVRPAQLGAMSVTHLANTITQQVIAQAVCPVLTVRG